MKILCIGSAVVDIFAAPIEKQELWKEKQRIQDLKLMVGGDAANQSIRLADLGASVSLVSGIGSDSNGSFLKAALKNRNVEIKYLAPKPDIGTGTALVLVHPEGERHTFSIKGAHSELCYEDCLLTNSENWDAVSLASLFSMPKLEQNGLLSLLQEFQAKKTLIFSDLANDKKKQGIGGILAFLPYIDYFLPSLYDAVEITNTNTAEEAAGVFRKAGAKNVILKCGAAGCYYQTEENLSGWIAAPSVHPIDTTGAGDCMVALFLHQILLGKSLKDACTFACYGASYSTLFPGASAHRTTMAEYSDFLEQCFSRR